MGSSQRRAADVSGTQVRAENVGLRSPEKPQGASLHLQRVSQTAGVQTIHRHGVAPSAGPPDRLLQR